MATGRTTSSMAKVSVNNLDTLHQDAMGYLPSARVWFIKCAATAPPFVPLMRVFQTIQCEGRPPISVSSAGKCRTTDGDKYAGAWEAGKRQGLGACIFANGDRYQGQWAADLRHGSGACEYANGDVYRGGPRLKGISRPKTSCTHCPMLSAATPGMSCHAMRN